METPPSAEQSPLPHAARGRLTIAPQTGQDRRGDRLAEQGWNGVADLVELTPLIAAEGEPVGKALEPGGAFVRSVRCPSCKHQTTKRLCPHCHMELPHTTGDLRNYIFALIGAKDSGKSHYLAVLITQIRKHLGPDLDLLLEPINDYTIRRFREQF